MTKPTRTEASAVTRDSICAFIARYRSERGYPPSLREIGDHCGLLSTSTVAAHLRWLRNDGRIDWDAGCPRTLHLTGENT